MSSGRARPGSERGEGAVGDVVVADLEVVRKVGQQLAGAGQAEAAEVGQHLPGAAADARPFSGRELTLAFEVGQPVEEVHDVGASQRGRCQPVVVALQSQALRQPAHRVDKALENTRDARPPAFREVLDHPELNGLAQPRLADPVSIRSPASGSGPVVGVDEQQASFVAEHGHVPDVVVLLGRGGGERAAQCGQRALPEVPSGLRLGRLDRLDGAGISAAQHVTQHADRGVLGADGVGATRLEAVKDLRDHGGPQSAEGHVAVLGDGRLDSQPPCHVKLWVPAHFAQQHGVVRQAHPPLLKVCLPRACRDSALPQIRQRARHLVPQELRHR
jgi:hypothetical protein